MAQVAPRFPTTETLHTQHEMTHEQHIAIEAMRLKVAQILGGFSSELLVVMGPCSINENDQDILQRENDLIASLTADSSSNIIALHRMPPWKPRTKAEDWHGLETTHPEMAYEMLHSAAANNANVAIEAAQGLHMERYGHLSTLIWKGGRNFGPEGEALVGQLGSEYSDVPVAIKNKLDGTTEDATRDVDVIELERSLTFDPAPAVLLYRGGKDAETPQAWRQRYIQIFDQTQGRLLVDVAHGGEMAHDPKGKFDKSVIGQIACLKSVIDIAKETGRVPQGVFIEASDAESWTDPVMPLEEAIEKVRILAALRITASREIQQSKV
jgi:hypothetical protein